MTIRVWVLVDMHYKPKPIGVDVSCNRDSMILEAKERNFNSPGRFKVFTARTEVNIT